MNEQKATQAIQPVNTTRLVERLDYLIRTRLWAQILIAMVLGIGVGLALSPTGGALVEETTANTIASWHSFCRLSGVGVPARNTLTRPLRIETVGIAKLAGPDMPIEIKGQVSHSEFLPDVQESLDSEPEGLGRPDCRWRFSRVGAACATKTAALHLSRVCM